MSLIVNLACSTFLLCQQFQLGGGHIYYIKNKDAILGAFRWEVRCGLAIPVLVDDLGLPSFIARNLELWLQSLRPPKRRRHIQEACGLTSTRAIIDVSLGLSLTDCLWITKVANQSWEKVNLFENPFNETIAKIAFTGESHSVPRISASPEFCTDGMLPTCWAWEAGDIYLKKAGMKENIYAEVLASQVCEVLGTHM